jgi:thiol-disulfide isomerase/thioredoxin
VPTSAVPVNVVILIAALVVATVVGIVMRRVNGHFRGAVHGPAAAGDEVVPEILTAADLRGPLGQRATLVQFSSSFCAPCRSTRHTLAEVAALVPGVTHVEVDAEHRLDLVRRLGVMRTPTTFILDANGAVVTRASGAPSKGAVVAAVGRAIDGPADVHSTE